jgi:hypothetical protein
MIGLRYRESLPPATLDELEQLVASLRAFLLVEHNEDGTLYSGGTNGNNITRLTGDVTTPAVTGPEGVTAATIPQDTVTFAKMQNIATDRLVGRDASGSGDPAEIAVGGGLEFSGSNGIQRSALTGDVTASAASNATTIANNAVTDGKLRDSAAVSVIGRSANSTGDPADIAAGSNGQYLQRQSNALSFAGIAKADLTSEATTTATGTQDDGSFSGASVLRCNNATDLTITGFVAGVAGQTLTVVSVGAGNVYLAHQTGSSSSNRLINYLATGNTPLCAGKGSATYQYDATTQRWRLVGHDQGAPLSQTFDAGDFTGSGTITWTVASGDVSRYSYYIVGTQMFFGIGFNTTTVSGTGNELRWRIPNGYTAAGNEQGILFTIDNGAFTSARFFSNGAGTNYLSGMRIDGANWAASTNATYLVGSGFIEIQ